MQQGAFSDLEDLLDASHKLVEESVDSRARSQQGSPAVTRDTLHQVAKQCKSYTLQLTTHDDRMSYFMTAIFVAKPSACGQQAGSAGVT